MSCGHRSIGPSSCFRLQFGSNSASPIRTCRRRRKQRRFSMSSSRARLLHLKDFIQHNQQLSAVAGLMLMGGNLRHVECGGALVSRLLLLLPHSTILFRRVPNELRRPRPPLLQTQLPPDRSQGAVLQGHSSRQQQLAASVRSIVAVAQYLPPGKLSNCAAEINCCRLLPLPFG